MWSDSEFRSQLRVHCHVLKMILCFICYYERALWVALCAPTMKLPKALDARDYKSKPESREVENEREIAR